MASVAKLEMNKLLSDHLRRHKGVSEEKLSEYVKAIKDITDPKVETKITGLGYIFICDFVDTLTRLYLEEKKKKKPAVAFKGIESTSSCPDFGEERFLRTHEEEGAMNQMIEENKEIGLNSTFLDAVSESGHSGGMEFVEKINLKNLVKTPNYFDGTNPMPREWIEDYQDAIDDNVWNDKTAIYYFKHFLTGDAASWFKLSVKPLIKPDWKWNNLYAEFEKNFLGRAEENRIRLLLKSLTMKKEDRANVFIPRVRQYLLLLNPKLPEDEQVNRIIEKLKDIYMDMIVEHEPQTIAELMKICRKVEAARDLREASRSSSSTTTTEKGSSPRHSPKQSFLNQRKKSCHRCGRNNHLVKDCVAWTKLDGTRLAPVDRKPSVNMIQEAQGTDEIEKPVDESIGCSMVMTVTNKSQALIRHEVKCNNVVYHALIDSGSIYTIISETEMIKNKWDLRSPSASAIGANGQKLNMVGMLVANIEIVIGCIKKEKQHKVHVVRGLPVPFLLGTDLLKAFHLNIQAHEGILSFGQESGLLLGMDAHLEARCETIVPVVTTSVGLISTLPYTFHPNVITAFSMDQVERGTCKVLLCNKSNKSISLKEGTKVAGVYRIIEEERNPNCDDQVNLAIQLPHSNDLVNVGDDLSNDQIQDLREIISKHRNAFSCNGELGCATMARHKIELLPGSKPVAEPLRRRNAEAVKETSRQVKEMLRENIIEESSSPWASAYVLAKKKTGDWRLCIDFRKLNKMTKKNSFPLPRVDNCLDVLSGKSFYSQFDFASGYWQVEVEEESREFTAFRTEEGLYQFRRMPFGLSNAPATFQKLMNLMLSGVRGIELQVYLDDICIASNDWNSHLCMVDKFLSIVEKANLKLKGQKCLLGAKKILFLGHEVDKHGIRQDPQKLKAIQELPPPKDVSGVRQVIGMMSYYRKFVNNFAEIASPLIELTKKNANFKWTDLEDKAFIALKKALLEDIVLANFEEELPVMLKTDASRVGIAGILLQEKNSEWRIVACCSRRINSAERNYGVTDLEALAVIYSMQQFRNYLIGRHFVLAVDHSALKVLEQKVPTSGRLHRWAIILSEFDFEVHYIKGKNHEDVDCISRHFPSTEYDEHIENKVYSIILPVDREKWLQHYNDEESMQLILEAETEDNDLKIIDELLYKSNKIYVPEKLRKEVLKEAHNSVRAAHGGINVTLGKMNHFWWPTIAEDTRDYVKTCELCQTYKTPNQPSFNGQMRSFAATRPMEMVCVDTCGPIQRSLQGNRYVIVLIDVFTRFIDAKPVEDDRGFDCALFIREFCGRFGPPSTFISDNGPQYLNDMVNDTLAIFGVERRYTAPDHPQGNSPAERAIENFQLKLNLNLKSQADKDKWDVLVPTVVMAINSSVCSSTGYTPYELMFGRKLNIMDNLVSQEAKPHDDYNWLLKSRLDEMFNRAMSNQSRRQEANQKQHNQRYTIKVYKAGDMVMVRDPNKRRGKLDKRFIGPYKVISRENDIYKIEHTSSKEILLRHSGSLKPFVARGSNNEVESADMNLIIVGLCLAGIAIPADAGLFDVVSPIIWYPSKSQVVYGETVRYSINYGFSNPCTTLTNYLEHWLRLECNKVYVDLWEKPMQKLATINIISSKRKRIIGTLATVFVVTNIFTNFVNFFRQDTGTVTELRKSMEQSNKALYDITYKIGTEMAKLMEEMMKIKEANKQMLYMVKIVNELTRTSVYLLEFIDTIRQSQQIPLKAAARLFNLDELLNANDQDTNFIAASFLGTEDEYGNDMRIDFEVTYRSNSSIIYNVDPFAYWTNLQFEPTLLKYSGANQLLYNKSNNCLIEIGSAVPRVITETCTMTDYRDQNLDKWTGVSRVRSYSEIRQATQFKQTKKAVYVYCFPGSITIEHKTYLCPTTVFKLPLFTTFNTSDKIYAPRVVNVNVTGLQEVTEQFVQGDMREDFVANNTLTFLTQIAALSEKLNASNDEVPIGGESMIMLIKYIPIILSTMVVYHGFVWCVKAWNSGKPVESVNSMIGNRSIMKYSISNLISYYTGY